MTSSIQLLVLGSSYVSYHQWNSFDHLTSSNTSSNWPAVCVSASRWGSCTSNRRMRTASCMFVIAEKTPLAFKKAPPEHLQTPTSNHRPLWVRGAANGNRKLFCLLTWLVCPSSRCTRSLNILIFIVCSVFLSVINIFFYYVGGFFGCFRRNFWLYFKWGLNETCFFFAENI